MGDPQDPMRDSPLLERAVAELRQPVRLDASFDARVMHAARGEVHGQAWNRWVRPRAMRVSPIAALALAASLVGVAVLGVLSARSGHVIGAPRVVNEVEQVATRAAHGGHVQFVLVAPTARHVAVVGDFNDWDVEHRLVAQNRNGVWSVTAHLPAGHHTYAFVVDDTTWVPDPAAPRTTDEDFGIPSSAVVVGDAGTD